jgi:hypothetical protein
VYGPFGGTVKVWNSCEHLANILRRRLRLQLHNVLRSLVTRGTHALSPCKIVYVEKRETSRPRPAQHELKHTTATPARPLSHYASQLEHSRFSKHAQPVCGMKQEVPKPKPRNDGFSARSRARCAAPACVRGPDESSGTTSHRTRTATGHRHRHRLQVGSKSSLGL